MNTDYKRAYITTLLSIGFLLVGVSSVQAIVAAGFAAKAAPPPVTHGVIENVERGEGDEDDTLYIDLVSDEYVPGNYSETLPVPTQTGISHTVTMRDKLGYLNPTLKCNKKHNPFGRVKVL